MADPGATAQPFHDVASAAYLLGREDEAAEAWMDGHHACEEVGDAVGAAHLALRLSTALIFKGDLPRASGWIERARRGLEEVGVDCAERGFLDFMQAMMRLFLEGDVVGSRALFARAGKLGARFRDRELRTMALIGEGRCLVYLGEVAEGVAMLDEAMVAVERRELPAASIGDAYCTVIDAVHELFDIRRSDAWVSSFASWCGEQPGLVQFRGHLCMHLAEVHLAHGRLAEGLVEASNACSRLTDLGNVFSVGVAYYVHGELLRLAGDERAAERAYEQASEAGSDPQPGLSLLRFSQGRLDAAESAIRRVAAEADGPLGRGRVLAAFAEIVLEAGDLSAAEAAADELSEIATAIGSPFLRAQGDHIRASVALRQGDATAALVALRRAHRVWGELDVPYEGARTRAALAVACEALGDAEGGALERSAARAGFERIGARSELRRLGRADGAPLPVGLTAREVEVLVLVAKGNSNRAIADELFISEKTVATHVGHVFTKLGVSSRAAATAFAYEQGLIRR